MLRSHHSSAPDARVLCSPDNALSFTLMPRDDGLFVERTQVRAGEARVVQSTLFADDNRFNQWCDADPIRFSHPMLYCDLKRTGDDHFRRLRSSELADSSSGRGDETQTLSTITASPGYAERVNEVVVKVAGAASEIEALELLTEGAHRLGAEVATFGSFVNDDGAYESFRGLLACDALWCRAYEAQTWYANDPWLEYAIYHADPARASEIPVATKAQQDVVDLAASFGFRSAVIVPAPSSRGLTRVGVLTLGSSKAGYFETNGYAALKVVARSFAAELHEWWFGRIRQQLLADTGLTDGDLRLLKYERIGHTTKMIAAAVRASPSSIDSRFQRINQKLSVANRKAAATVAAEYGLI